MTRLKNYFCDSFGQKRLTVARINKPVDSEVCRRHTLNGTGGVGAGVDDDVSQTGLLNACSRTATATPACSSSQIKNLKKGMNVSESVVFV